MNTPDYEHMIHCPCCGAPITGNTCEYCGCVIYDFADIDLTGKPSYIRINIGDVIFVAKVVASPETRIEVLEDSTDYTYPYGYDHMISSIASMRSCRITMVLDCEPQGGELFRTVNTDRPYSTVLDRWGVRDR